MKKIVEGNYTIIRIIISSLQKADQPDFMPKIGISSETKFFDDKSGALTLKIFSAGIHKHLKESSKNIDYLVKHLFHRIDSDVVFREKCFAIAYEVPECDGVILFPDSDTCYLYSITKNEKTGEKYISTTFVHANVIIGHEFAEVNEDNVVSLSEQMSFHALSDTYEKGMFISFVVTFLIFKHYAKVQTLYLDTEGKKRKSGTLGTDAYESQCRLPIQVIDSRWFTEVVGEGFGVKGHWRKQWYATESAHKIIWINDFQKSGYTRKAGKDSASIEVEL